MKKIFGIVLLVMGLMIILGTLYLRLYTESVSNAQVEEYMDYVYSLEESTELTTEQTVTEGTEQTGIETMNMPDGILGLMEIEKIDLVVTIAEGVEDKDLIYSVGHFPETVMPGEEGNFAVVGHRSYTYGQYFNRLDELEFGDKVKVRAGTDIYTYIIDDIKVVEPEEVSVLDNTDTARITLVTCTPIWSATHRLIVSGYLEIDEFSTEG